MKKSNLIGLNTFSTACLVLPLIAALSACGGGGSDGGNVSQNGTGQIGGAKFNVTVATDANITLQPGSTVNLQGFASTSDVPLARMVWTVATPLGAPITGTTNSNCAIGNKATNKNSSDWDCLISMTAPVVASKPITYTLVLTATDTLNNVRTASRTVIVNFDPAYIPVLTPVNIGQPFTVIVGATAPLSCPVPTGSTVAWSVTDNGGLPISLSSYGSAQTSFVAPTVAAPTPITLTCNVTDLERKTSAGSVVVTIQPAPPPLPPIVRITAAQTVKSLAAVAITATAPTGYYFFWETVGTPQPLPTLAGANSETVSFIAPTVATPTTYIFKVTYGTQPITASYTGTGTAQSVVVVTP